MNQVRALAATALSLACLLFLNASVGTAQEDSPPEQEQRSAEEAIVQKALEPWTGDFDEMLKRRAIRVLVVYDGAFYFVEEFKQRGLTYEAMTLFEKAINKRHKLKKGKRVHIVLIPVSPDRLISGLVEGLGDIAAANLTITAEREEKVAFSAPFTEKVQEILVGGPAFPMLAAVEDLSGLEVAVRPSSSYHESLQTLNQTLEAAGREPVKIIALDEHLQDSMIVEMIAAGVYPATVMDDHKAKLWGQVSDKLVLQEEIVLRDGGAIAWAFRKDSPKLAEEIDAYVKENKVGTLTTNILIKRYLENTKYVEQATSPEEQARFTALVDLFKSFAGEYDFDWLLLIAQGYQESGLDQSVVSPVGAIGLMQLMPKTAAGDPINIPDIKKPDNNVHAGAKYLRYLMDHYFDDPAIDPLNRHLLALAAYNAGPTRIQRLRKDAAKAGLDPNLWFNNVEIVVAKKVGREPVDYVANIFKYYIAYSRIQEQKAAAVSAEEAAEQ